MTLNIIELKSFFKEGKITLVPAPGQNYYHYIYCLPVFASLSKYFTLVRIKENTEFASFLYSHLTSYHTFYWLRYSPLS